MRSFTKALTNIRRTPYQATAAILVLTITFFVAIAISFITVSFYQALMYFETRPQVLIFFETDATSDQIQSLQDTLNQKPNVSEVTFIPQEEALSIYQQLNQNDPLLLELVTADILPASLEVSTYQLNSLKDIASEVETATGVEEVALRNDVVDSLNQWLTGIRYAGVGFVSVMGITSILIITIVVGMKISGKQSEIKILRLIGAKTGYIQAPFLFEGAIYGLFSSLIAYVITITLLLYSTPQILQFAGEIPLLPTDPIILASIFGASIFSGIFIGTFGSWIAIKRYLKL